MDKATEEVIKEMKENDKNHVQKEPGYYANQIIRKRNGGVKHQFEDSIGGCSSNYR
jgi:hypothetical protein